MNYPSRDQLRQWRSALTLGPLDPGDPAEHRYVPLQEAGRGAVDEMMATIELAFDTTTQFLSGPSGAGKTTELQRLRSELESKGFRAVLFDVTKYVNESSPSRHPSTSQSFSSLSPSGRTMPWEATKRIRRPVLVNAFGVF